MKHVEDVEAWTLFCTSIPLIESKNYLTVVVGSREITATIAITALNSGITPGRNEVGGVAANIRRYQSVEKNGKLQMRDFPEDKSHTHVYVSSCHSITFGISVTDAEAFALCTIYFYNAKDKTSSKKIEKANPANCDIIKYNTIGGQVISSHSVIFLDRIEKKKADLFIKQVISNMKTANEASEKSSFLQVKRRIFQPQKNQRVDVKSKKLISPNKN
jgi:hypothetical protein